MSVLRFKRAIAIGALLAAVACIVPAWARGRPPITILMFGTSLTQGLGLQPGTELPVVLRKELADAGIYAHVVNAGVSGDTSADGASRITWSLADRPDAAIVELGSNDALRGLDPRQTQKNIADVLGALQSAHVPVLLLGMKAPRNLGAEYARAFDAIYPRLAARYGDILYPFVLQGVALDPKLNQADGLHPNPAGVRVIAARLFPYVRRLIAEIPKDRH